MVRHKISFYHAILFFFFTLFLFCSVICADEKKEIDLNTGTYVSSLTLNNGLLSIEAENAPLEVVLKELFQKTGTEFTLRDPSLSADLLSVSFRDLTPSETLARILKNYSYISINGERSEGSHIIILALKGSGDLLVAGNNQPMILISESGQTSGGKQGLMQAVRPQNLDECQKLEFTEDDMNKNKAYPSTDPENAYRYDSQMLEADRMALDEAKIKRAQKVLTMERCSHLWEQAIHELTWIQDDRITSLLSDIAKNGKTLALKTEATNALWHNTAGSEFKNVKGINALKNLTTSSDEGARHYAQEAVKDYENYMKRTTSSAE
jgi:hypothetical protein